MYSFLQKNKWNFVLTVVSLLASVVGSILVSSKVLYTARAHPVSTATLHTSMGDIKIRFLDNSPKTVENFIKLAQSGFYDNTHFHRVVPNLLIQGGDPLSKFLDSKVQWGKGGPGYFFPDEINEENKMLRGAVAMANSGPNTNGSQFFILSQGASFLQGQNTIFGFVEGGLDVVDKIASVPVGVTGIPSTDIELISIILE